MADEPNQQPPGAPAPGATSSQSQEQSQPGENKNRKRLNAMLKIVDLFGALENEEDKKWVLAEIHKLPAA